MPEPTPPSFPSTIGRYQILEELGRGAMGVVYRGFDPNVGRSVAIKTVLLDQGDPETIRRFKREAQAAGILSHPSIVTIYDAGEDQGMFYIAMEFVEGHTLQAMLRKGPLPMDEALKILTEVGEALDHAHNRQIIHRDVKPANIILTDERAKIMDFGVAKITAIGITTAGSVMGTPAYMSPEAVQGHTVDGSTDVFSLGVMFYEMITGKRPFHGDSVTTVMYKIISEQAAPLATVNRQLPPSLDPVLKKALAKSPKQRYQQCADLVRDVKKALEGAGTGTPPTPVPAAQQIAEAAPAPVAPAPAESKPERTIPSGHHAAWPHGAPPAAAAPAKVAPRPLPAPKTASKGPIIGIAAVAVVLLAAGAYWFLGRSPAEEQAAPQPVASEPAPAKRGAKKAGPAPAPTKTATKTGSLEVLIKSNVDGATISVDGKTQPGWETPRRIPISPGAHTIQVSKPGYQTKKLAMTASESGPREFTLNMTADAAAPKATAPPPEPKVSAPAETGGQGSLRVLTEPAGASIFVDGKKTPYQSPVIVPLPAGKHTIVLQHRRHEPVTREVVIEANKIGEIKVNLAAPK